MIIQLANCQLEIGQVYEQTCEAVAEGPLEGWICGSKVRIWPKI